MSVTHECPITRCAEQLPTARLMCRPHWRLVPVGVQRDVTISWRRRGDSLEAGAAYVQARRRAIELVNAQVAEQVAEARSRELWQAFAARMRRLAERHPLGFAHYGSTEYWLLTLPEARAVFAAAPPPEDDDEAALLILLGAQTDKLNTIVPSRVDERKIAAHALRPSTRP